MKLAIAVDTPVQLKRNLENPYDQFAIKVMCQEKQIGYIPAYENIVLANLLNQGVVLSASVSDVVKKEEQSHGNSYLINVVAIQVFTELMLPATHIQLADSQKTGQQTRWMFIGREHIL